MNFVELAAQNVPCVTSDGNTRLFWCIWTGACQNPPYWLWWVATSLRDLQAHTAAGESIWNWVCL